MLIENEIFLRELISNSVDAREDSLYSFKTKKLKTMI